MANQPPNEADLVLNIRDQPNHVIIRTYNNYQDERTDYRLKRKSGFHLDDAEHGRLEFASDSISSMRPASKKACKEIVGVEERRDPMPSTTDENDGDDDRYYREPAAELPPANNNTNNSITEFQSNTENNVTATANNNGNTENGVIVAHDNLDIAQIDRKSDSNNHILRRDEAAHGDHHMEQIDREFDGNNSILQRNEAASGQAAHDNHDTKQIDHRFHDSRLKLFKQWFA
ncbi:unnamed protein product [Rotaria sp. Silwood2]|nr:unnamed protein product [Rotaria sp. Silwood2]